MRIFCWSYRCCQSNNCLYLLCDSRNNSYAGFYILCIILYMCLVFCICPASVRIVLWPFLSTLPKKLMRTTKTAIIHTINITIHYSMVVETLFYNCAKCACAFFLSCFWVWAAIFGLILQFGRHMFCERKRTHANTSSYAFIYRKHTHTTCQATYHVVRKRRKAQKAQ